MTRDYFFAKFKLGLPLPIFTAYYNGAWQNDAARAVVAGTEDGPVYVTGGSIGAGTFRDMLTLRCNK